MSPDDGFPKSAPDAGSYEADNAPWPAELRVFKSEGRIEIDFTDGKNAACRPSICGSKALRPRSRAMAGRRPRRSSSGRRHVKIAEIEPVGHYAIRIIFDDKHDTGIYSWSYLRELGDTYDERWAAYQAALCSTASAAIAEP